MLLAIGDLTEDELLARTHDVAPDVIRSLAAEGRLLEVRVAGEGRFIAAEDAARVRDALGVQLPPGIPAPLLERVRDPMGDLTLRYARTHAPFTAAELARRFGLAETSAEAVLVRLVEERRLLEGEFRPGGTEREWTHPDVLRMIRRRSLAKMRREVEPVDPSVLARFATTWQGVVRRRPGTHALVEAVEQLQGAPLAASILETEILPARVDRYDPADLDALLAAGEVVWAGVEPLGDHDGRVALYLADRVAELLPPPKAHAKQDATGRGAPARRPDRERALLEALESRGASFFGPLHEAAGGGYPGETVRALWSLVWQGLVSNDTFQALRAFTSARAPSRPARTAASGPLPSRRLAPPSAEGRWSLLPSLDAGRQVTAWAAAMAHQLLARHGIVTREGVAAESIPGGFGTVYPVLKALEEHGRVRRGYFVAGLGAAQFALPGALDLLRELRNAGDETEAVALSATDPANPYGAALKFPPPARPGGADSRASAADGDDEKTARGATRTVGTAVILVNGALAGYLTRGDRQLLTWLPEPEPGRSHTARALARVLIERARSGRDAPRGMLIEEIDGVPAGSHALAPFLVDAGFAAGALGLAPRPRPAAVSHANRTGERHGRRPPAERASRLPGRRWRRQRLALLGDVGRDDLHDAARGVRRVVNRAGGDEEGLARRVGRARLPVDFDQQRAIEHIADLFARMGVAPRHAARLQLSEDCHRLPPRNGDVDLLQNGALQGCRGRLLGVDASRHDDGGHDETGCKCSHVRSFGNCPMPKHCS
jgi:ATP-dependent Lhr-like helicase